MLKFRLTKKGVLTKQSRFKAMWAWLKFQHRITVNAFFSFKNAMTY